MSASADEQPIRPALRRPAPIVAISATYGAGGAQVGEHVARVLGVPFLAHTFSAEEMVRARQARGEQPQASAYLRHRARGDMAWDDSAAREIVTELESRSFFDESDAEVLALLETGGVVVGRAGPYVLRDEPGVLHALLDGPREARIAAGAALEGVDREEAVRRQLAHDASRIGIARLHYGVDPNEVRFYQMQLDSTALGLEAVVEILVIAARACHAAAVADPGADS